MPPPQFTLTFNDASVERWNRYWLTTLVRAARYGGATAKSALAAVDLPYTSFVEGGAAAGSDGSGLGHWVACRLDSGGSTVRPKVLVALAGDCSVNLGWYAGLAAGGIAAGTGVPGKVAQLWLTLAAGLQTALAAALALPTSPKPTYFLCGHGASAAVAQVLAWQLAAANPGAGVQLACFGSPPVGNTTFVGGFANTRVVHSQNPYDPVPDSFEGASQLAAGLAGNLTHNIDLAQPPGRNVWRQGYGFAFSQFLLPGAGGFFLGIPLSSGARRPQYVTASAEYQIRTNQTSVWSHLPYYYALGYWTDTLSYLGTTANRQQVGEARGYDLGALDTLNASLSVQDGYALSPQWPVSPPPGP